MVNLNDLIGQKILFRPKEKFQPSDHGLYVTLRGVESGGICVTTFVGVGSGSGVTAPLPPTNPAAVVN